MTNTILLHLLLLCSWRGLHALAAGFVQSDVRPLLHRRCGTIRDYSSLVEFAGRRFLFFFFFRGAVVRADAFLLGLHILYGRIKRAGKHQNDPSDS